MRRDAHAGEAGDSKLPWRRDDSLEPRAEAVERARRLLAEPGYPDLAAARALSGRIIDFLDCGR